MTDLLGLAKVAEALSRPACLLIEKCSNFVGQAGQPYLIKAIALAEKEKDITQAKGEIEIGDLQRRAATRWLQEEAQKQQNMESVVAKANPNLGWHLAP